MKVGVRGGVSILDVVYRVALHAAGRCAYREALNADGGVERNELDRQVQR